MTNSVTDPVAPFCEKAESLTRAAYDAGFQAGRQAALESLKANLGQADLSAFFAEFIASAMRGGGARSKANGSGAPPDGEAEAPEHEYGAITAAVRKVMASAPARGLQVGEVVDRAERDYVRMSVGQAREALRRLKVNQYVRCKKRRWWVPTEKLRAMSANENGAPEGAPDAGKGVAPQA